MNYAFFPSYFEVIFKGPMYIVRVDRVVVSFIFYCLWLFFYIVYWLSPLAYTFCFNVVVNLFNMIQKYRPKDKVAEKERLLKKS